MSVLTATTTTANGFNELLKTTPKIAIDGIEDTLNKSAPSFVGNSTTRVAELDSSRLTYSYTTSPRNVPVPNSAEVWQSGYASDHMITCRWTATYGWETPEMKPYGAISLLPTASCLHYATECFEGMKIFRGNDGKLRLFRPEVNVKRMLSSALRIALPAFPPDELLKLIAALAAVDGPKWAPTERPGTFFYVRPTLIGTSPTLAVKKPDEALLYIFMCAFPLPLDPQPAAPASLLKEPKSGIKLFASQEDTIRAWPGGFGHAKVGANYGPSLVASTEAARKGFDQILWLFGQECWVTEAGASNFFVVFKEQSTGRKQLITAPLEEQIILPGVNRASVLEIAREKLHDELDVVERRFTIQEVIDAAKDGRLVEAFAAGTVYFIAPVEEIHYRGTNVKVPVGDKENIVSTRVAAWLKTIQYEHTEHPWAYIVDEKLHA